MEQSSTWGERRDLRGKEYLAGGLCLPRVHITPAPMLDEIDRTRDAFAEFRHMVTHVVWETSFHYPLSDHSSIL